MNLTTNIEQSYGAAMKSTTIILTLVSFFFTSLINAKSTKLKAVIEKISDGDTIQVRIEGSKKITKVRLLGIDTPETDFNGASQGAAAYMARDYLQSLIPVKAEVILETYSKSEDIHQRLLAVVYYNQVEINQLILENGMAFTYFIFPYDKSLQKKYAQTSQLAWEKKLGIFADNYKDTLAPYLFRQEQKGAEGNMIVASESKRKLFHQIDIDKIPHFDRVFFAFPEQAIERGFSW